MLLELVSNGRAHLERGNRQRVERTDLWCLRDAVNKPREPREPSLGLVDRSLRGTSLGRAGEPGGAHARGPTRMLRRVRVWKGLWSSLSSSLSSAPIRGDAENVVEVSNWFVLRFNQLWTRSGLSLTHFLASIESTTTAVQDR